MIELSEEEKPGKIKYVVAIATYYAHPEAKIVLIEKTHGPDTIIGKWIGPGGKVEGQETIYDAMAREFGEETGMYTTFNDWSHEITYEHEEFIIYFMSTNVPQIQHAFSTTDENVVHLNITELENIETTDSMKWALYITLDKNIGKPIYIECHTTE